MTQFNLTSWNRQDQSFFVVDYLPNLARMQIVNSGKETQRACVSTCGTTSK